MSEALDQLYNRGNLLMSEKKYDQAVQTFQKLLGQKKDDSQALNNLAVADMQLGELEKALSQIDAAILLDPKDDDFARNREIILKAQ